MLFVRPFQRADQDEPLVGRDQPRPDVSHTDVVQVVEDLEWRDVLQRGVVGLPPETLGPTVRCLTGYVDVGEGCPEQADHNDGQRPCLREHRSLRARAMLHQRTTKRSSCRTDPSLVLTSTLQLPAFSALTVRRL